MTRPVYLNDDQKSFIAQALRHAAEVYEKDAIATSPLNKRLSEQFSFQADKARALAAAIENDDLDGADDS